MIHKLWHWLFGKPVVLCAYGALLAESRAKLAAAGFTVIVADGPLGVPLDAAVRPLSGKPLPTWRKCAACDGTGLAKCGPMDTTGFTVGGQGAVRALLLSGQGICLACEGRGGRMEKGGSG